MPAVYKNIEILYEPYDEQPEKGYFEATAVIYHRYSDGRHTPIRPPEKVEVFFCYLEKLDMWQVTTNSEYGGVGIAIDLCAAFRMLEAFDEDAAWDQFHGF